MKKELQYVIWAHVILVIFLIYESFDLIMLLNDNIHNEFFTHDELNNQTILQQQEQMIPKIIHQTYKTTEVPEIWKLGQQLCIDLHPDYQYILWTDEMSREFILEKYPWFLEKFESYKYPIERADLIRYFVLNHYGGIYIDLDDGCKRRLDPLINVPAFLRKTSPTGISNDVMGSIPRHPFFTKVINDISRYDHDWYIPYITIMISTGPLFLSVMWKQYKRWGVDQDALIKVLSLKDYKDSEEAFFQISTGSSWHTDDAKFFFQLLRHLPMAVTGGVILFFTILALEFILYKLICLVRLHNLINLIRYRSWNDFQNQQGQKNHAENLDNDDDEFGEIIHLHQTRMEYIKRNRKDSNLPVKIDWEKQPLFNTEMV